MKKLLMMLVVVWAVSPVFAQDDEEDEVFEVQKNSVFYLGAKGGVTMTSMTQPKECDLYDGSGIGFSGGLAMKARFSRASENANEATGMFGLGLELKYKQNNVKTIANEGDLKLGYFEVPVALQFYPFAKSNAMNPFYIEVGGSFAGIMSKSPDALRVNNPNEEYQYVSYHTGDLKGFDIRPLAGIGYCLPISDNKYGLDLNARYYLGTSELAKNFPCKMSTIEVSLCFYFGLARF